MDEAREKERRWGGVYLGRATVNDGAPIAVGEVGERGELHEGGRTCTGGRGERGRWFWGAWQGGPPGATTA
jgi:hypothetical protein